MWAGVGPGEACGHCNASEVMPYGGTFAPGVRLDLPIWRIEVTEISSAQLNHS